MKNILKSILIIAIFVTSASIARQSFADETQCRVKGDGMSLGGMYSNKGFSDLEKSFIDEEGVFNEEEFNQTKSQLLGQLFSGSSSMNIVSKFADQYTCANKNPTFTIVGLVEEQEFTYEFPQEIIPESLPLKDFTVNAAKLCNPEQSTGNNCSITFKISSENGTLLSISENNGDRRGLGEFLFRCDGDQCRKDIKFSISGPTMDIHTDTVIEHNNQTASENCKITKEDISFSNFTSEIIDDRSVALKIKTEECLNTPLKLVIVEDNTLIDGNVSIKLPNQNKWVEVLDFTPIENEVVINFKTHRDHCDNWSKPDCSFFVEIYKPNGSYISTLPFLEDHEETWEQDKSFTDDGIILANCDGLCDPKALGLVVPPLVVFVGVDDESWKIIGEITGVRKDSNYSTYVPKKTYDPNNPCYSTQGGKEHYIDGCYEFLAPIPGIEKDKKGEFNDKTFTVNKDGSRIAITNIRDYQLGDYVNKLFQIAVAILAVISVIMIVIAGVQYMVVESIYGKSDAKKRIMGAVGGLILALGIYTILWTINPKLLEVNFGNGIDTVSVETAETYGPSDPVGGFSKVPGMTEGQISPGIELIKEDLEQGIKIKKIFVEGSSSGQKSGRAYVELENGKKSGSFLVGFGKNGINNRNEKGSNETPVGTWKLGNARNESAKNTSSVWAIGKKNGIYAGFGPAYISIDEPLNRGLAIHGKSENTSNKNGPRVNNYIGYTFGCVRIRNEDLELMKNSFVTNKSKIQINIGNKIPEPEK